QTMPYLPASYRINGKHGPVLVAASTAHIKGDLSVEKLNKIHGWLQLAGLPIPPRPLNYQRARSREITACEDTNLHLVWAPGRMFLKPLPQYLLVEQFWQDHLVEDRQLYELAFGLLLSYVALIQYPSDFAIAQDTGLIDDDLEWDEWVDIAAKVLAQTNPGINKRYTYGELRLSRLNKIFWAHGHLKGYHFPYQTYGEMFKANIAPVAGATVYVALVLTAMQVGLATHALADSDVFHNASYGFAVFSILAPIGVAMLVLLLILVYFFFN
ncbi:hypothetical protein N656DRAFT_684420, partial [Canariomyces notabilis]